MGWLGVLVVPLVLASCTTADLISSSSEVKRQAYEGLEGEWGLERPIGRFGRERSLQVFEGDRMELKDKELKISGAFGMAAFVTEDGYALTAEHVVSEGDGHYAVLVSSGDPKVPVHVHWVTMTMKGYGQEVLSEHKILQLLAYHGELEHVGIKDFEVVRARVVKDFPRADLALIKFPLRVGRWFEPKQRLAEEGEALFMPGNSATPYAGSSAGRVVEADVSAWPVAKIHTSAPLASGDSGGPAIDVEGKLVGIISHVRLGRFLPWPKMNHSLVRQIDAGELVRLIEADRVVHGTL